MVLFLWGWVLLLLSVLGHGLLVTFSVLGGDGFAYIYIYIYI